MINISNYDNLRKSNIKNILFIIIKRGGKNEDRESARFFLSKWLKLLFIIIIGVAVFIKDGTIDAIATIIIFYLVVVVMEKVIHRYE